MAYWKSTVPKSYWIKSVMRFASNTIPSAPSRPRRAGRGIVQLHPTALIRQRLEELRNQTDPHELRQEIYNLLDRLFETPGATPGISEDVHQPLSARPSAQKAEHTLVTLSIG